MCVKYGADFLGFIFYKKSKRYCSPAKAKDIIKALKGAGVRKVGVFVNEIPENVEKIALSCGLDYLQFHGDETPGYVRGFKKYRAIKAIRVLNHICFDELKLYSPSLILFDTFKKSRYGGTGEVFDWSVLKEVKKLKKHFIVSGGLTPENVGELVQSVKPYAVDVAGGVEEKPGFKDRALVKSFIERVKVL